MIKDKSRQSKEGEHKGSVESAPPRPKDCLAKAGTQVVVYASEYPLWNSINVVLYFRWRLKVSRIVEGFPPHGPG